MISTLYPGVMSMRIMPMAMPNAQITPMMVSALCLVLKLTSPMIMEAATEKMAAPNVGEIPV